MKATLIGAASALATMILLDAVWLSTMLRRFYAPRLAHLMADSPFFGAAAVFYLIYAVGLSILVVVPAFRSGGTAARAFWTGALFGVTCYATYDLTNQATLKNWSTLLSIVDMAWGAILTGTVATVALAAVRRFS